MQKKRWGGEREREKKNNLGTKKAIKSFFNLKNKNKLVLFEKDKRSQHNGISEFKENSELNYSSCTISQESSSLGLHASDDGKLTTLGQLISGLDRFPLKTVILILRRNTASF